MKKQYLVLSLRIHLLRFYNQWCLHQGLPNIQPGFIIEKPNRKKHMQIHTSICTTSNWCWKWKCHRVTHAPFWTFFDTISLNDSLKLDQIGSKSKPFSKFKIFFWSIILGRFWEGMNNASLIFLPLQCFSRSRNTAPSQLTECPLFFFKWEYKPLDSFLFRMSPSRCSLLRQKCCPVSLMYLTPHFYCYVQSFTLHRRDNYWY